MKKRATSFLLALLMALSLLGNGIPVYAEATGASSISAEETTDEITEDGASLATPSEAEPSTDREEAEEPEENAKPEELPEATGEATEDAETEIADSIEVATPSEASLEKDPEMMGEIPLKARIESTDSISMTLTPAEPGKAFSGGERFVIYSNVSVSGNQTTLEEGAYSVISLPKAYFQKPQESDVSDNSSIKAVRIEETDEEYQIIITYHTINGGQNSKTPIYVGFLPSQVVNQEYYEISQRLYDINGNQLTPESTIAVQAKAKIESFFGSSPDNVQFNQYVDENFIIKDGTIWMFSASFIMYTRPEKDSDPRDRRVWAEIPEGTKVQEGTGWSFDAASGRYYRDIPRDDLINSDHTIEINLDLGGIDLSAFDSPDNCKELGVDFYVQPVVDGVPQTDLGPIQTDRRVYLHVLKNDPDAACELSTTLKLQTVQDYAVTKNNPSTFNSATYIPYNSALLNEQQLRSEHTVFNGMNVVNSKDDGENRELIIKESQINLCEYVTPKEVHIWIDTSGMSADKANDIKNRLSGTKVYGVKEDGSRVLLRDNVPVEVDDFSKTKGWSAIPGGEAYKAIVFEYPNDGIALHGQEEIDAVAGKIHTGVISDFKPALYTELKERIDKGDTRSIQKPLIATTNYEVKYKKAAGDAQQTTENGVCSDSRGSMFCMLLEKITCGSSMKILNGSNFLLNNNTIQTKVDYRHIRPNSEYEGTMPENIHIYYLVPDGLEPVDDPNTFTDIEVIHGYADGYNLVVAKPKTVRTSGGFNADVMNDYILNFAATGSLGNGNHKIYAALAIDNNTITLDADGRQQGILQEDKLSNNSKWRDLFTHANAKNHPANPAKFTDLGSIEFQFASSRNISSFKDVKLSSEADDKYATSLGTKAKIGDAIDYRWTIKNGSSQAIDSLEIIDVLPFLGDKAIVANNAGEYLSRGSRFKTPLLSVEEHEKFDIYYSTDTVKGTVEENYNATWSQTAGDMSQVTMIKAVLKPGKTIQAGESIAIITHNQIENDPQIQDGEKAYNSFAITTDGGNSFEEARKVEVPVTSLPETGNLKVEKTVTMTGSDAFQSHFEDYEYGFTVTLNRTDINGTYGDMTFTDGVAEFTLKQNQSKTAIGLPAGTKYDVVETDPGLAEHTIVIETPAYTTIEPGSTGKVSFKNFIEEHVIPIPVGNLKVTKIVSGAGGDTNKAFTFTVTLEQNDINGTYGDMTFTDGVAVFTLKHGQSKTAIGLPAGIGYTVEESENSGYTVTKTKDRWGINPDETVEAVFENHKDAPTPPTPPTPKTGSLMVTKTVSGTGSDQNEEFTFTVTLDRTDITGQYGDMTFTDGVATFTLKHGQSKTATGLPVGTTYTVDEPDSKGYLLIKANSQGTIQQDFTSIVPFQNYKDAPTPPTPPTPKTGSLMVTKTVSGSQGDQNKAFTFTVTLDKQDLTGQYGEMDFTAGVATFTLKHGQSKTAERLPAGVSYTVEETDNAGYTVTKTNEAGTIQKDVTATAAFENYKGGSGGGGGGGGSSHTPEKAHVTLSATKTLDGQIPTGSGFTFVLSDADGHRLQVKNNQGGSITFDTLTFDKTGTYVYYLTEQAGNDPNVNYDTVSYKVMITVTRPHDYAASVAYEKNGQPYYSIPAFVNATKSAPQTPGTTPSGGNTTPAPGGTTPAVTPAAQDGNTPVTPARPLDAIPKTNDPSHVGLWALLAACSALSLAALMLSGNRRRFHYQGKHLK